MVISRITGQDQKGVGTSGSASATYPGATTSGNLLIASVMGNTGTDTLLITSWTKGVHSELSSNNNAIFYKLADGTETTVTATGGSTTARIHIYEYTGNANPIVVDTSNNTGNLAATSAAGASITTTNANDLLFASIAFNAAVTSPAATAPFNARQSDTTIRLFDADQIVSATGTYAGGFSWTTSAQNRNCIIAFKAASAATGTASVSLSATGDTSAQSTSTGSVSLTGATGTSAPDTATGTLALAATTATAAPTAVAGVLALTASATATAPTTGTATLSLSATAATRAPDTATGSLALTAAGAVVAPTTGSGSLALSATGSGVAVAAGTGTLNLAATGSGTASDTGTAVLALTATANPSAITSGTGTLTLVGTGSGRAVVIGSASLSLAAAGIIAATAGGTAHLVLSGVADASIPHHIAADERLAHVLAELRHLTVAAETRRVPVPAELRQPTA